MAIPKNDIGGNLVQPTNIEIASSSAVPPTDGNTNAAVDGSLATTASGLYQRTGGSWQKLLAAGSSQSGVQQEVVLVPNTPRCYCLTPADLPPSVTHASWIRRPRQIQTPIVF